MTTFTLWVIVLASNASATPALLDNSAYPTRDKCEHEVVRMRQLAMSFRLTPVDCWCEQLVMQK